MVVCGDDALAHRLAAELRTVYRERVTLLLPAGGPPDPGRRRAGRAGALLDRVTSTVSRLSGGGADGGGPEVRVHPADGPDEEVFEAAGVRRASALALVYDDDEANVRAALLARRLNPRLRLVIRLYNRRLGEHLEALLDQAATVAGFDPAELDASTTVLSDADTAAPALVAAAVAGTSKVIQADGLLLRAVERTPPASGQVADPGLCTLALLSSTSGDPSGAEGSDASDDGPTLLPDDAAVAAAAGRGILALQQVAPATPTAPPRRLGGMGMPLGSLFSRRLVWSAAAVAAAVVALALTSTLVTGDPPLHAVYLSLLDLFAINDPAVGAPHPRQVLQLLSGLTGLLLLPVLVAAALEGLGTFRTASSLRRPPRGLTGHLVLVGLGKVGTRVLLRLREMNIPVVCVEADPEARGVPLARRLRVPTVLGDATEDGVLETAGVRRAHALLALTSSDSTNLEACLYARAVQPRLRVVLRLFDDGFATAVYRTLRAAHPRALTRSRSVSSLSAPAFAGAMMGRRILGAIPVERRVLLFAAVDVAGHRALEGRSVAAAFRPGAWRVVALDSSGPDDRTPDLTRADFAEGQRPDRPGLVWDVRSDYVLCPQDRVVLAATRQGLAELLERPAPQQG
ncbi:NAD-binding protein [Streptomyces sp. NPDC059740]|uniref:NAD-binding protein n=1 Tax=Streptomyces sp. NPDC059740 TaxID=3346926 RepID=UPI0036461A0A